MRVAFEISHLNHEKISGVGIYTRELLKALRGHSDLQMLPVWRPSRWRHRRFFKMHIGESKPFVPGLLQWGADILHGPDFRVGPARGAKRIASIMDLGFLRPGMTSPEFAKKKQRDLDSLLDDHTPDALIVISEATRRELIVYRPHLEKRIFTTLLGGDHMQILQSPMDDVLARAKPYFLFVGNLEARKNVLGILRGFEKIFAENRELELLLVGKPGFEGDKILAAVNASPAHEAIRVIGYSSLADLQAYYRHAVALVYPSWLEGFGIPVVEAMQLGCPVITSRGTSTEEIAGDTGWLVEPGDHQALVAAMGTALDLAAEPAAREVFVGRARAQAALFTWERCATETKRVYRMLAGQG